MQAFEEATDALNDVAGTNEWDASERRIWKDETRGHAESRSVGIQVEPAQSLVGRRDMALQSADSPGSSLSQLTFGTARWDGEPKFEPKLPSLGPGRCALDQPRPRSAPCALPSSALSPSLDWLWSAERRERALPPLQRLTPRLREASVQTERTTGDLPVHTGDLPGGDDPAGASGRLQAAPTTPPALADLFLPSYTPFGPRRELPPLCFTLLDGPGTRGLRDEDERAQNSLQNAEHDARMPRRSLGNCEEGHVAEASSDHPASELSTRSASFRDVLQGSERPPTVDPIEEPAEGWELEHAGNSSSRPREDLRTAHTATEDRMLGRLGDLPVLPSCPSAPHRSMPSEQPELGVQASEYVPATPSTPTCAEGAGPATFTNQDQASPSELTRSPGARPATAPRPEASLVVPQEYEHERRRSRSASSPLQSQFARNRGSTPSEKDESVAGRRASPKSVRNVQK